MNNYQERISQAAERIHELIEPVMQELGLGNIEGRTQVDILILVHALREVQDLYLDEISDGQFRKKQETWPDIQANGEFIYRALPPAKFIDNQERVIFRKDGQDYIIYGPEQVGDPDRLWSVFKALPEEECGSDDDPDYEFATYEELQKWAENA